MRLAEKIISYLYSAFDKSPVPFIAFRARRESDDFRYVINEFQLDCFDGDANLFTANLNDHTIGSLADFIATQDGMSVVYLAPSEQLGLSSRVLLEGAGSQAASNGDCFFAYSSLLWSHVSGIASELADADASIEAALDQMSIKTADSEWLDEWGGYFGIQRKYGEIDSDYSERIIFEILRPRGNNKAIEIALASAFKYPAQIVDAPMVTKMTYLVANGSTIANGSRMAGPVQIDHYGEFDAVVGFDLMSPDSITSLMEKIREVIEGFRDAGTRLRQVSIDGKIEDVATASRDSSILSASVDAGSDLFPAIRILADGSVVAGGVNRVLCDGSIVANGLTSASGFGINGAAPKADSEVDLINVSASTEFSDRMESPIFADGLIVANGGFDSSGYRGAGIDDAFIYVRSMMIANGRHRVGDGAPVATGSVLANGLVACGAGSISVNEFSTTGFRLM